MEVYGKAPKGFSKLQKFKRKIKHSETRKKQKYVEKDKHKY